MKAVLKNCSIYAVGIWGVFRDKPEKIFTWKLVAEFRQPWTLHNLREDRTEMTDLSTKYSERARHMDAAWQQWANEVGVIPWEKLKKKKKKGAPSKT